MTMRVSDGRRDATETEEGTTPRRFPAKTLRMIYPQTVDARADPEADEAAVGVRDEDAAVVRAFSIASVDDESQHE